MKVLEWKNYNSISSSTFEKLYEDKLLTDVTLACDGNKKIEAHRVVLSACSHFFNGILQENRNPHPLIYLQGIEIEHLILLKKFMYLGRAMIEHDQIQAFFEMSKNLLDNETKDHPQILRKTTEEKPVEISDTTVTEGISIAGNSAIQDDSLSGECFAKVMESKEANVLRILTNPINLEPNGITASAATTKGTLPIQFIAKVKQSCLQCKYKTFDYAKLTDHIDKIHSERLCLECGISLEDAVKLKYHLRIEHTTYSCKVCSFTTGTSSQYYKHKSSHSRDTWLRCDQCEFTSYSNYRFKAHREIHNQNNEFRCKSCDLMTKTLAEQVYHNKKVHKGERYDCEHCAYSATTKYNLKMHEISVHGKAKHFCRFCTYSNSLTSRVKLHEKRKHNQEMEEDNCHDDSLNEHVYQ